MNHHSMCYSPVINHQSTHIAKFVKTSQHSRLLLIPQFITQHFIPWLITMLITIHHSLITYHPPPHHSSVISQVITSPPHLPRLFALTDPAPASCTQHPPWPPLLHQHIQCDNGWPPTRPDDGTWYGLTHSGGDLQPSDEPQQAVRSPARLYEGTLHAGRMHARCLYTGLLAVVALLSSKLCWPLLPLLPPGR